MTISSKRLKLFKKTFYELLEEYNKNITSALIEKKKIKIVDIELFGININDNLEDFINRNNICFTKIKLLDPFNLSTIDSTDSTWEYIKNLYIISQGTGISKDTLDRLNNRNVLTIHSNKDQTLNSLVPMLQNIDFSDFSGLINEIAIPLMKSLEGKNISPKDLLSGMLSGNSDNGIDFSDIIEQTTNSIQTKVNNGELDINILQSQAKDIFGKLDMSSFK